MQYNLNQLKELFTQLQSVELDVARKLTVTGGGDKVALYSRVRSHELLAVADNIKAVERNIRRMQSELDNPTKTDEDSTLKDSVIDFIVEHYSLEVPNETQL